MVAGCRAMETQRLDGLASDPFAERLAGPRGMEIARGFPPQSLAMRTFGIAVRTLFLDEFIARCVKECRVATVLNLGCGLDSRPWRLPLPSDLKWIEVDFQDMLDYKARAMEGEDPKCRLLQIEADVSDEAQRRRVFDAVGSDAALMISEGLLMYLPSGAVEAIAAESHRTAGIRHWVMDLTTAAFAKGIRTDFRQFAHLRADDHLNGEGILSVLEREGWRLREERRYVKDLEFALGRISEIWELGGRGQRSLPPQDDPTGVHWFSR